MKLTLRKSFQIFAPGSSLRRRVAYSLAFARLILVPVILLAVYYLFEMGFIVDQIVSVDAPAATYAQKASIEMLEARRAERNYLLLHDPVYLQANRDAIASLRQTFEQIRALGPDNQGITDKAEKELDAYETRFAAAVAAMQQPGAGATDRIQAAVRAYEQDLNALLKTAHSRNRSQLIDELRKRIGSFDAQITETVQEGNPALRDVTQELQASSQKIMQLASQIEKQNWTRVENDRAEARHLLFEAEWALGIVSSLTVIFSVWVSFLLPRQVVKPLVNLREAVDHAATGNYEIEFDIQGEGEVAELAKSIRGLLASVKKKE